jgi:hypothetical protein
MLNDLVKRHPQSSVHLSKLSPDWDNRATSNRGKTYYTTLSFLAQDVVAKYRNFCHKNKIRYPPVINGDHADAPVEARVLESEPPLESPVPTVIPIVPPEPPLTLIKLIVIDPEVGTRIDPTVPSAWDWFDASTRRRVVGTIQAQTIADFVAEIRPYIPEGRKVRELYGSLVKLGQNVTPPSNELISLDQSKTLSAFYASISYQPAAVMAVLHRTEPNNASPGPEVRSFDDLDYEQPPEGLIEVVSDSEDDRIPRKFVPPQKPEGFIRRLERTSRAINRHVEMSHRLSESAKRFRCEEEVVFPHEPMWRPSMTELGHRTMKRKYVELGRDTARFADFYFKKLKLKEPIPGVHVTDDGKEKLGKDWEEEGQRLMEARRDASHDAQGGGSGSVDGSAGVDQGSGEGGSSGVGRGGSGVRRRRRRSVAALRRRLHQKIPRFP